MRAFLIFAVLLLIAAIDPGGFGYLLILIVPFIYARSICLLAGDIRRLGGTRR